MGCGPEDRADCGAMEDAVVVVFGSMRGWLARVGTGAVAGRGVVKLSSVGKAASSEEEEDTFWGGGTASARSYQSDWPALTILLSFDLYHANSRAS